MRKIIFFLLILSLLTACMVQPTETPIEADIAVELEDDPSVVEIEENPFVSEIEETTPPATTVPTINELSDGIRELNITKTVSTDYVRGLGHFGNYLVLLGNEINVLDLNSEKVVYTAHFGLSPVSVENMGDHIHAVAFISGAPGKPDKYFDVYVYEDHHVIEPYVATSDMKVGEHVIVYKSCGIFEQTADELIELLPPAEDPEAVDANRYSMIMALDDHRFLYGDGGYEWRNGIGVYDFTTHTATDIPNTFNVYPATLRTDTTIFAMSSKEALSPCTAIHAIDVGTLEITTLVDHHDAGEYHEVSAIELSPDKKHLVYALTLDADTNTFTYKYEINVLDLSTNSITKSYHITSNTTPNGSNRIVFLENGEFLFSVDKIYGRDTYYFIMGLK